jgi:hypothetical protein
MIADKIGLIGSKGNMGKRYSVIMDYIGIKYKSFDIDNIHTLPNCVDDIESFIVATPTETHYQILMDIKKYNLPILCEKAITKDSNELSTLLMMDAKLAMVNQYEFLVHDYPLNRFAESHYNYFKSGSDGLVWDCINIIGLAINPPLLANNSPVWECMINGKILNIADMDFAYISMIEAWKNAPWDGKEYIYNAHKKVLSRLSND